MVRKENIYKSTSMMATCRHVVMTPVYKAENHRIEIHSLVVTHVHNDHKQYYIYDCYV